MNRTASQASPGPLPFGVQWRWSYAARGILTGLPSATVALWNVEASAALAVGLIPVCSLPLAPVRRARIRSGTYGVLAAASILLGGTLAQWPVAAVVGIALAGGFLGHVVAVRDRPIAMLGLMLCLPLLAVGLSYPGVTKVAGLGLDILVGTVWSVLVALAWPTHDGVQPAVAPAAQRLPMLVYGWIVGLAGAVCAAVGFAAGLEHVGWAPAAAMLVMRPLAPTQRMRSLDRLADVVIGAVAATLLVLWDPASWVYALAVLLVVTGATATAGSRWYVLPTFTTCLVFVLLLAQDPADAGHRFWERVLETALGVGVAAVASFVVLPAVVRRQQRQGHRPGPAAR
jgi:uncharacterized membrane protein YccC